MAIQGYYLGCPMWGFKGWAGNLYRRGARPRDFLAQYASVFNTVEGNSTFYSLPPPATVERWRDAVPATFRFCFKLPRTITHERGLAGAGAETAELFRRMAPLGQRLGPFMIQLPPSFGPDRMAVLEAFLRALPRDFHYAVELRHRGFYASDASERRLDEILVEHRCERIVLDTRSLRSGDPRHPDLLAARHGKPNLPATPVALGRRPLLRFISHPDAAVNLPWLERWCRHLGRWIRQGRRPYVMVHCPNDLHSPPLARRLHALLAPHLEVGEMPPWPGEEEPEKGQLSLL